MDSENNFQFILNGRSCYGQEVNYLERKERETPGTKSVGPWNVGPITMKEISKLRPPSKYLPITMGYLEVKRSH